MLLKIKTNIDNAFLFVTGLLFFAFSANLFKEYFIALSVITILFFLGLKLVFGTKIKIPNNFILYEIFVLTTLLHFILVGGQVIFFWMFFIGGLYWLTMFNVIKTAKIHYPLFLISLGFLMLAIFIYYYLIGVHAISPDNLFLPQEINIKHNHLGDLWGIVLVLLTYLLTTKPKIWQIILSILGLTIITFSLSRSALASFTVGALYIFYKQPQNKFTDIILKYKTPIIIACSFILIYIGSIKSIFFSRPYYLEAIISLFINPLGIGMGNFANASTGTNIVHNIVLEVVSGIGVFSLVFIYWLYKMAKDIFTKKEVSILYSAISLAIFINFSFDSTYVIPVFMWIWFSTLALIY